MAFEDLLDGYQARHLSPYSELGSVMDPLTDKCILTSATILLSQPEITYDWIPYPIAIALMALFVARNILILRGYFVLSVFWKIQAVQPNRWGKLSTATQIFLIFLTLLNSVLLPWNSQHPSGQAACAYCFWLCCGACALASGISYLVQLDQLFSTKNGSRSVPKTE